MYRGRLILKKYRKWFIVASVFLLSIVSLAFSDDLFQIAKNLDIFTSVYKEVNINYVDEINSSKMLKSGIDAMLMNLDPYTIYVPEADMEDYKLHYVSTQFGGVGASVFVRDKKIYFAEISEGFPAYKANIRPGDQLVKINDVFLLALWMICTLI